MSNLKISETNQVHPPSRGSKHRFPVGYADHFELNLPEGHRFPVSKYRLLKEQLLHRGILEPEQLYAPELIPEEWICLAHVPEYVTSLQTDTLSAREARKIGLPVGQPLLNRAWASASITFWSAHCALDSGIGGNLGGGTHHAYADHGEGFCVFNDVAISALFLLREKRIRTAMVVDLDVHQGNGTAALLATTSAVFTFSMHCQSNYPIRKERSDLDVALPAGTTDSTYLQHLEENLPKLIEHHKPDVMYFIAGSDVLEGDRLGHFSLSRQGMAQRDYFVLSTAHRHGIPLVLLMGGGYHRSIATSIDAHTETYAIAAQIFT